MLIVSFELCETGKIIEKFLIFQKKIERKKCANCFFLSRILLRNSEFAKFNYVNKYTFVTKPPRNITSVSLRDVLFSLRLWNEQLGYCNLSRDTKENEKGALTALSLAISASQSRRAIYITRVCTTLITLRFRNFHNYSPQHDSLRRTFGGRWPRSHAKQHQSSFGFLSPLVRGTIAELNFKVT